MIGTPVTFTVQPDQVEPFEAAGAKMCGIATRRAVIGKLDPLP